MKAAVLLAALSAGLALFVANQIYGTRQAVTVETSASPAPAAVEHAALPKIVYRPKRAYDRISDDDLFSPDRRPPPPDAAPGPAPRPRARAGQPNFELKGIVITPAGRYALLKMRGESDYRTVEKGENVEGWVVDAIESDSIVVKKQSTSTIVRLKTPKSSVRRNTRRPASKISRTPPRR